MYFMSIIKYIRKKNKNIVFTYMSDFDELHTKSLEEFSIKEKPYSLLILCSYIKKRENDVSCSN